MAAGEDAPEELDLTDPALPLTAIDRQILAMKDEDYHRHTWEDLKEIIGSYTLSHMVHAAMLTSSTLQDQMLLKP